MDSMLSYRQYAVNVRIARVRLAGEHRFVERPEAVADNAVAARFGDERFVPADHPDSNYRMVRASGLAGGAVSEARVHRVPTDLGDPR
jgi:6-phosphogluconolactonase/glucosamine-6-phosphate isomerase/deaminase